MPKLEMIKKEVPLNVMLDPELVKWFALFCKKNGIYQKFEMAKVLKAHKKKVDPGYKMGGK